MFSNLLINVILSWIRTATSVNMCKKSSEVLVFSFEGNDVDNFKLFHVFFYNYILVVFLESKSSCCCVVECLQWWITTNTRLSFYRRAIMVSTLVLPLNICVVWYFQYIGFLFNITRILGSQIERRWLWQQRTFIPLSWQNDWICHCSP